MTTFKYSDEVAIVTLSEISIEAGELALAAGEEVAALIAANAPEVEIEAKREEQGAHRRTQLQTMEWRSIWGLPAIFAGIVLLIFVAIFRDRRDNGRTVPEQK